MAFGIFKRFLPTTMLSTNQPTHGHHELDGLHVTRCKHQEFGLASSPTQVQ
jgi:hypothetical protein